MSIVRAGRMGGRIEGRESQGARILRDESIAGAHRAVKDRWEVVNNSIGSIPIGAT